MRTVGLFEAKQKLSELVERASEGEQIGITRRGKLAAVIVPARSKVSIKEIFDDIEDIRKHVNRSKRFSVRELIEEGRT
ncbi:MAG: type II toxin-antitoxin system prevent-host-death family antitoxin [Candidatus Sulfotelmatobacter sp.]